MRKEDLVSRQVAIDVIEEIRVCIWEVDIPSPTVPEYMEHHIQMQKLMDKCDELKTGLVNLPPADAVVVVRCKDCVHWDSECDLPRYEGSNFCYMNESRTKAKDFCSYGERKDNE